MPAPAIEYASSIFDGARWAEIDFRDDDIVVCTPAKAGTTWTQNIILHLIFQDLEVRVINELSPFIEIRMRPFQDILERIEAQTHRRCLKSHLPFDGVGFSERVRYVIVARDARDIFMSAWNFYRNFSEAFFEQGENPDIPPLARPPQSRDAFWDSWISRGTFAWEEHGFPLGSPFDHIQSWWEQRHRDNVLIVHFNDLLADLEGQIARIDGFLGTGCPAELFPKIRDEVSFASMKKKAELIDPDSTLVGGANTFINKGTNGRWRGVLSAAQLAQYDAAIDARMTPEARAFMERGWLGL